MNHRGEYTLAPARQVFDVIVVGSGSSGGWVCKRLAEAAIKVALVDAGRPQSDANFTEHKPAFELKCRSLVPEFVRQTRPVQNDCYACTEYNYNWFANDLDEPYTTPADKPFSWQGRMRVTGGRTRGRLRGPSSHSHSEVVSIVMRRKKDQDSRRKFLQSMAGVGIAARGLNLGDARLADAAASLPSPAGMAEEIYVGNRRQLLCDDFFLDLGVAEFESYPHNIRWKVGRLEKSPHANILVADQPWEDRKAWFCVLYDQGRFRVWYNASRKPDWGLFVCYAESDDGLTWRKPVLNLIERNGSKQNNFVFTGGPDCRYMELGSVFRDPSAQPAERYKMFYTAWESKIPGSADHTSHKGEKGVLRGAYSSDGLHWSRYPELFLGRYADSQNVANYDPVLKKYVGYIRCAGESYGELNVGDHPVAPGFRGRALARMESDDYRHWSRPELALSPDFEDGLNLDFYLPAYSRYDGADHAHFMFPSAHYTREGTFHPVVAVSRDNRRWMRPTREDLFPLGGPGDFDETIISIAPGFLPAGRDQTALYYRSANILHWGVIKRLDHEGRVLIDGAGRVVFKRDRIVGIEAGDEEGTFWTRPLLFEGRRLVVNVEPTGPAAQLSVQMIGVATKPADTPLRRWVPPGASQWPMGKFMIDAPCPGFTFEDAIPIAEDGLDSVVRWKGGSEIGAWVGKPVRLHFRLRSMRIYAFQFVE